MPTFKTYIIGFILSLALTLAAYFAVLWQVPVTVFVITGLAMVQLVVQMIFFLHVGQGKDRHWNLVVFFSTLSVIFILVAGSIWIMNHLNYNMTPGQMEQYMLKQEGIMK
jgi:cytochrome o ubiquinol oxidase operon protein cyoD